MFSLIARLTLSAALLPPALLAQGRGSDSLGVARDDSTARAAPTARRPPWYERLSFRGYVQVRYNGVTSNPQLTCPQCDRTIGSGGGLSMRRARIILSGDVTDRVSIYVQPDFAAEASGGLHYGQLRDVYVDVALDARRTLRLRLGQSKIPYGWENLQSSSNRLPLDRADALNSALPNERDVATVLYYAPSRVRERFRMLVDSGLKGSGDYGMLGIGLFNGQGANRPDANNSLHAVARATYPFLLPRAQIVEASVQGYIGRYVLPTTSRTAGLVVQPEYADERIATTLVLYPRPLGVQAEWNWGTGPEFDRTTGSARQRPLHGGYAQVMGRVVRGQAVVVPFARGQWYEGGKKFENDARRYQVREYELGVEWTPFPSFEITPMYVISDRRYEDLARPVNRQQGRLLRLQAQFSY